MKLWIFTVFIAVCLVLSGCASSRAMVNKRYDFRNIKRIGVMNFKNDYTEIKGAEDIFITELMGKNFNVIETVLSRSIGSFVTIKGGGIDGFLGGPLKSKLNARDTIIEKAQTRFSFHDKTVFIDDFLVQTDIFELTAKGSVDQGLNTDMQTMLHLNGDVSAALVNEFDGLKYLMDDSKRIAIDASLKGIIPHLKYKPNKDFRKKSKKVLIEEGRNILSALLGGGQTSSQSQATTSQDTGKKTKMNFKNIFKNILQ